MSAPIPALIAIDVENQTDLDIWALLKQLRGLNIVKRLAYADLRNRFVRRLLRQLWRANFDIHHACSGDYLGAIKNTADGYMARGIRAALAMHPEIQVVIIVSGDHFFADIARELAAQGRQVIVAADPFRTARELRAAAHRYIPLGTRPATPTRQAAVARPALAAAH